jgi:hypothetical protein
LLIIVPFLFALQMTDFDLNGLLDDYDEYADAPLYCTQASRIGLPMSIEGVGESSNLVDGMVSSLRLKFWVRNFMLYWPWETLLCIELVDSVRGCEQLLTKCVVPLSNLAHPV